MSDRPPRCVVDTNVPMTAEALDGEAPERCARACAGALGEVVRRGHVFLDDGHLILREYVRRAEHLPKGAQPGPGQAFFKWILQNQANPARVTRVPLTRVDRGDGEDFAELPEPSEGVRYDPSDRKFLAVAAAHPEHPEVLQALDSKWWGWQTSLARAGVTIRFLCPRAIEAKHREKMGP